MTYDSMTRNVRFAPSSVVVPRFPGKMLACAPVVVALGGVALGLGACGSSDLDPIQASAGETTGDASPSTSATGTPTGVKDAGTTGAGGSGDATTGDGGGGGTGSADAGHGDGGGHGASTCKRGIASTTTPPAGLAPSGSTPGVTWWYDWSNEPADAGSTLEFVPMIWGSAGLAGPLPAGAHYVLGFNEPNFTTQSNLTPTQAAADWPQVEKLARGAGIPIVSPAVNYCGSQSDSSGCSDPAVTDPYTWLQDFLAACPGCEVDAIAVHWYNCDLPSLQGYIEGNTDAGGGLAGFVQFGKPIWLTEFSCDGSATEAQQESFMKAAIPYLEASPYVQRYSWFSAGPIPNALLVDGSGALTDLGKTYVALPETSCE